MIRRNQRGRFAKQRVASRWERIICLSILGGIFLGIAIDYIVLSERQYVYAKEPVEVIVEPKVVQIEVAIDWNRERIEQEYRDAAKRHKVSEDKMIGTMLCESSATPDIQSHHTYTFSDPARGIHFGERELSFGTSQIHLPDHPYVTKEEANNPAFAAEFMADAFAKGKAYWWTCYRDLYM